MVTIDQDSFTFVTNNHFLFFFKLIIVCLVLCVVYLVSRMCCYCSSRHLSIEVFSSALISLMWRRPSRLAVHVLRSSLKGGTRTIMQALGGRIRAGEVQTWDPMHPRLQQGLSSARNAPRPCLRLKIWQPPPILQAK